MKTNEILVQIGMEIETEIEIEVWVGVGVEIEASPPQHLPPSLS